MTVFAHAGHWLLGLAYLAPLVVLLVVVGVGKVKDRRAAEAGEPAPEDPETT